MARATEILVIHQETMSTARRARAGVKLVGWTLALGFTWLQFRGVDFAPVVRSVPADLLFKASLALYYFCWVFGLLWDIADQELVLIKPPGTRKVIFGEIMFAAGFMLTFGAMCYMESYRAFANFLAAFLALNVLMWRYYVDQVLPNAIKQSRQTYEHDRNYIAIEQLLFVNEGYLRAAWQRARFGMGFAMIAFIELVVHVDAVSQELQRVMEVGLDFIVSALLFIYVVAMEGWIWIVRVQTRARLHLLQSYRKKYQLRPL